MGVAIYKKMIMEEVDEQFIKDWMLSGEPYYFRGYFIIGGSNIINPNSLTTVW